MRVEVTFAGDASGAVTASEMVEAVLKAVGRQAEETGVELAEVKITSRQATETAVNARRMQDSVAGIGREARQTRREIELMNTASLGGAAYGIRNVRTIGLAGLLGLGAAVSGPAAGAAGAGLAALPGLAAAGGAAIGVLVASFNGLGKAISGDRQEFEKLTPVSQQFVQTLRSLEPWLKRVQELGREGLFPGLTSGLHAALTPANAQQIEQAVSGIGKALGDVAEQWGKGIGSPAFTRGFGEVMQHSAVWLREGGDAAEHLAGALGKVTVAALPLVDWMQKGIDDGARLLDSWVAQKQASGELAHGLSFVKDELVIVGHFGEQLLRVVFELARALTPLGNEILVGLTHELQNTADWIDKNREGIRDFALGALHGLEDVLHTIGPALGDVARALKRIVDNIGGWKTAFEIIIAGTLASKVADLARGFFGLRDAELAASRGAGEAGLLGNLRLLADFFERNPYMLVVLGLAGAAFGTRGSIGGPDAGNATASNGHWVFGAGKGHKPGDVVTVGGERVVIQKVQDENAYVIPAAGAKGAKGMPDFAANLFTPALPQGGGSAALSAGKAKLLAFAKQALGVPYVWGGSGLSGFDCSGLVMWAFANGLNVQLPHFTGDQFKMGTDATANPNVGDVVFTHFDSKGVPQHEGLIVGFDKSGQPIVESAPHTGARVHTSVLSAFTGGGQYQIRNLIGKDDTGAGTSPFSATPPPFGNFKGGDALPAAYRLAIAKAGVTGATSDDIRALRSAIRWLQSNISTFTGEDAIQAYTELAALNEQLRTLRTKNARAGAVTMPGYAGLLNALTKFGIQIPSIVSGNIAGQAGLIPTNVSGSAAAFASRSSIGRTRSSAASLLSLLFSNPQTALLEGPGTVQAAQQHLAELRGKLGPAIKQIQKDLAQGLVPTESLAAVRNQLTQYRKTITDGITQVKNAVAAQKTSFHDVWSQFASAASDALNDAAAKWVSPTRAVINQLQQQHDDSQLQQALADAQQQLADALVGKPNDSAIVQNIQAILSQQNLANAIDQVQSAILGGPHAAVNGDTLLAQLNQAMTAAATPDPQQVEQAQKQVEEAKYQIKIAGLEKQAQAEEQAHADEVTAAQRLIQSLESQWDAYFTKFNGNVAYARDFWVKALQAMGLADVASSVASASVGTPDEQTAAAAGYPIVGGVQWTPGLEAQAQALEVKQVQAMTGGYGPKGPAQLHAAGGTFIARRPTYITSRDVVGEAGDELVQISPLSGAGGGLGDLHIYIGDREITDIVTAEIKRNGGTVSRTLGKRTSRRQRAGRA